MSALLSQTFADTAGNEPLSPNQALIANLPAAHVILPGSPMLVAPYVRAVAYLSHRPWNLVAIWVGAVTEGGRVVADTVAIDLHEVTDAVHARSRISKVITKLLGNQHPNPLARTNTPGGDPHIDDLLVHLGINQERLRAARRITSRLQFLGGLSAPELALTLALAGASQVPAEVPESVSTYLRKASGELKRVAPHSGQPAHLEWRASPDTEAAWLDGLEQGDAGNPLLRLTAAIFGTIVASPPLEPRLPSPVYLTLHQPDGSSRQLYLETSPTAPNGAFEVKPPPAPEPAPGVPDLRALRGARP